MGRTPIPLRIAILDKELWDAGRTQFQELIDQGHEIEVLDLSSFDLVLGEKASRFNVWLLPRLRVLLTEVRKWKRGGKK